MQQKVILCHEYDSCCNVHISTNSLNIYGAPSLNTMKATLPNELRSYFLSDFRKKSSYFPIRPRRIEHSVEWEISEDEFDGTKAIDYSKYHKKERFLPSLKNLGIIFQNPLHAVFRIYDEESFRSCYMFIPTIIHTLHNEHDKQQYVSRLHEWIKGSSHPAILQGLFVKRILDKGTYIFTEEIELLTLKDWIKIQYGNSKKISPQEFSNSITKILFQIAAGLFISK